MESSTIDQNKGAYIYFDNTSKTNVLFLYMKLSKQDLANALPISYKEDDKNTYLGALFINGQDYVGQTNHIDIIDNINTNNMTNILINNYNTVHDKLKNLDKLEFNNFVSFAKKQLHMEY